ncbi:hypothetical protein [Elioraea rosea]|uniref:hypothetical protein n=1 Tax=Elioraea rosea TaxID=2492390 RepID=UPI0011825B07|nr:hypothetical protein [Elioraea rosea]
MSAEAGAPLTVLGVAPVAATARLATLLGAGEGPAVMACRAGAIAAFAARGDAWRQHRAALKARLMRAASAAPFLPADPRHAVCAAGEWPRIVSASAGPLAEALARDGFDQQWEITVTPRRDGASAAEAMTGLRAALADSALGLRVRSRGPGLSLVVLMPREGGYDVARAAAAASKGRGRAHEVSVEGPLPPLAFAGFRIACAEIEDVARAWAMLALRDISDPAELARRWRGLAFALDPARGGRRASSRPLREAGRAYGLLRTLSEGLGQERFARDDLMALCGAPLALPQDTSIAGHARHAGPHA